MRTKNADCGKQSAAGRRSRSVERQVHDTPESFFTQAAAAKRAGDYDLFWQLRRAGLLRQSAEREARDG